MKPSEIQEFVRRENPELARATAGESLKNYQTLNGGTGSTFHDIERSWLKSLGYETWDLFLNSIGYIVGVTRENIRNFLSHWTSGYYLQENGTDKYLLEDGTGYYTLQKETNMADKKFSELDMVGSLTGTEILPVIQEGLPKRTTVADVVANYVLKSGDTMTGQLTSQIVAPSADSTYTLGTSSLYWKETYTDKLFLNSTATLDGSTAGEIKGTGVFTADNIKRGTGFPNGVVTANVGTVYIDTDVTNGASSWIKKSGTGNTGWQVLEGDTGWRTITKDPSVLNGTIEMKRTASGVYMKVNLSSGWYGSTPPNGTTICATPSGFSTDKYVDTYYINGTFKSMAIESSQVRLWGSPSDSGVSSYAAYTTSQAWPTTLP